MVAKMAFNQKIIFLIVLFDISIVFGQSNGDFWWMNQKLVNRAKDAREKKPPSARVINVEASEEDVRPVTEILDDIPPPVTTRNFISTTLRPQITTNTVRRAKIISRDFLFPDEITTTPPKTKGVQFLDNNGLDAVERSRRPQTFFLGPDQAPETATLFPSRNKRVRFQERSDDTEKETDQIGSASEINVKTFRDLSRYLTFS